MPVAEFTPVRGRSLDHLARFPTGEVPEQSKGLLVVRRFLVAVFSWDNNLVPGEQGPILEPWRGIRHLNHSF